MAIFIDLKTYILNTCLRINLQPFNLKDQRKPASIKRMTIDIKILTESHHSIHKMKKIKLWKIQAKKTIWFRNMYQIRRIRLNENLCIFKELKQNWKNRIWKNIIEFSNDGVGMKMLSLCWLWWAFWQEWSIMNFMYTTVLILFMEIIESQ